MAAKKKAKSKKAKSKVKSKKPASKKTKKTTRKTKKKVVKKKSVARKAKAKKAKKAAPRKKPAKKPAMKPAARPRPAAAPVAMPGEERIGIVTHYYNHLGVAIIQLETGVLRSGDVVHIKGHTSDFRQMVGSMEVNHAHVDTVQPGSSFGLRVNEHAREHDVVYKIANP